MTVPIATKRPLIAMISSRVRYGGGEEQRSDRLVQAAAAAARAGVDLVQVRERGLSDRFLVSLVQRIVAATADTDATVIVNDRVDVALAAGAGGVHLPAAAASSRRVRAIVPSRFLIGRSVHSESEALAEESEGACDYLVFGPVFSTTSKPADHPVAGVDALARLCRRIRVPVLAIGGVTRERVPEVAATGAAGIAAIGLFQTARPDDVDEFAAIVRDVRAAYGARLSNAR